MSDATQQLRTDYTTRKATLEAERAAFMDKANIHIAEQRRQLDDYVEQANRTVAAMTGRIDDHAEFLKWVDALEAEQDAATPAQADAAGSPDNAETS